MLRTHCVVAFESHSLSDRLEQSLRQVQMTCTRVPTVQYETIVSASKKNASTGFVFLQLSDSTNNLKSLIHRLRSALDTRIVVVGNATTGRQVIEIIRAGADDFVDEKDDLRRELGLLLKRAAPSGMQNQRKSELITVTSSCGGCGASSLAVNIAAQYAHKYGECGLVDLQMHGGDLATLLRLTPRHTISKMLANNHPLAPEMVQQALTKHETGISLLAGADPLSNLPNSSPETIRGIVRSMTTNFQRVVVELEDISHREQLAALSDSDQVVLTFRLHFPALARAHRFFESIERFGVDPDKVRIVASQVGQPDEVPIGQAEKIFGRKIDACITNDVSPMNRAVNLGIPVVLDSPKSQCSRDYMALVQLLDGETPVPANTRWNVGALFKSKFGSSQPAPALS
ncbi:AAA family ATPase [Rosistilla oblonga]|uniref:AAA family ATPase n=1 Tax=Rosistilla oblonga TaxID=2527990 RepID=UPI0011A0E952|nr:P-loop NTPase [Rosistilla oblonga]